MEVCDFQANWNYRGGGGGGGGQVIAICYLRGHEPGILYYLK